MYGKSFLIYGVHIPGKYIECMHFYSCQFPIQTTRQDFWKISFPQDERGGENHYLLYENSIKRYEDDFIFCMIHKVIALQFCKYLSNSVVLSLLPLLCNYSSLTLKLHQKE